MTYPIRAIRRRRPTADQAVRLPERATIAYIRSAASRRSAGRTWLCRFRRQGPKLGSSQRDRLTLDYGLVRVTETTAHHAMGEIKVHYTQFGRGQSAMGG